MHELKHLSSETVKGRESSQQVRNSDTEKKKRVKSWGEDGLARKQTRMTDHQTVTGSCRLRDAGLWRPKQVSCAEWEEPRFRWRRKRGNRGERYSSHYNSTGVHKYKEQSRRCNRNSQSKELKGPVRARLKRIIYYISYLGFLNRKIDRHIYWSQKKTDNKGIYLLLEK